MIELLASPAGLLLLAAWLLPAAAGLFRRSVGPGLLGSAIAVVATILGATLGLRGGLVLASGAFGACLGLLLVAAAGKRSGESLDLARSRARSRARARKRLRGSGD